MSEFDDDCYINKYRLDEELVKQPQLFYKWAKAEVTASDKAARAKDRVEITKSEIEIRIRRNPEAYDLPSNPKEALVKAAVCTHPKVKRDNSRYLRALRTKRLLESAVKSMEHRKKSLEGLVTTNIQMHFSTPKGEQRRNLELDNQSETLVKKANRKIRRR